MKILPIFKLRINGFFISILKTKCFESETGGIAHEKRAIKKFFKNKSAEYFLIAHIA